MRYNFQEAVKIKDKIRKSVLKKLKLQKEATRYKKSLAIKRKLLSLKEFKIAKKILLYAGKPYEVDTSLIIKEALKKRKRVFLPVTDTKRKRILISEILDLEKDTCLGCFGICEPKAALKPKAAPEKLDLVVMPGVAFDRNNNRIGHGAGYYDRFLKCIPYKIPKLSLAFDFQVLDEDFPTLSHDIPVTRIITN